jgi:type VI secretion system protein ImpB
MARASAQQDVDDGRVHITYDVETNGSKVKEELPFVIGVVAGLTGTANPDAPQPPLRERQFKEVDATNFDALIKDIQPVLDFRVRDTAKDDGTLLDVHLRFHSLEDFKPGKVAQQIPALEAKLRMRQQLNDLLTKVENNERFERSLEAIVRETEARRAQERGETKPS